MVLEVSEPGGCAAAVLVAVWVGFATTAHGIPSEAQAFSAYADTLSSATQKAVAIKIEP
jgi:hypothetical protein